MDEAQPNEPVAKHRHRNLQEAALRSASASGGRQLERSHGLGGWLLYFLAGLAASVASFGLAATLSGWVLGLVALTSPWVVAVVLAARGAPWGGYSLGAVLPWVLIIAAFCAFFMKDYGPPQKDFNAEEWRTVNLDASDEARLAMVDDLMDSGVLNGLRREEVLELLGPADLGGKGAMSHGTRWDLVYWLGPERMWYSDHAEWLSIRFVDGRVLHYRIIVRIDPLPDGE